MYQSKVLKLTHIIVVLSIGFFSSIASAQMPPQGFADLTEKLTPSVVNISTVQTIEAKPQQPGSEMPQFPEGSPFDDFFKEFFDRFNQGQGQPRQVRALGSGFVIDADKKLIVTNNHVIEDADQVLVIFQDGTEVEAKVLGFDTDTDLALLQIDTNHPLTAITWGVSDEMRVGDLVLAIGNPFGLGGTVTAGIISARARDIKAGPYIDYLQTDASINQGNSGGPMFNMKGEVIGINTAILSPSGGSVGIGFAIPSDSAKIIITQLEKFGHARRAWLGVRIQDVTEDIADSLGLKQAKGSLVGDVVAKGPAANAGLKMGDVIMTFNGKDVENTRKLQRYVAESEINSTAKLGVWRQGKMVEANVALGELEEAMKKDIQEEPQPQEISQSEKVEALGFDVAPITAQLQERFKIPTESRGVVITKLHEKSPAAEKGLHVGDVIVEAGMMAVQTPKDLMAQVERIKKDQRKSILLLIERKGSLLFIAVPITKM